MDRGKATNALNALEVDNGDYVRGSVIGSEGRIVVFMGDSDKIMGLLHTMNDLLVCLDVARVSADIVVPVGIRGLDLSEGKKNTQNTQ